MDGLTKLLLTKYHPELLQAPTAIIKSEAPQVRGSITKSAPEALQGLTGMVVVMSSADYSDSIIFKALREFNTSNPELMSRSFTLPVSQHGIPAGSWVFIVQEEND